MLRIRLAAAIAAVLFVALSEAAVRPGTCPDPKVIKIACDGTRAVEGKGCTSDDQCSAGRKCCDSPCGWKECFVAQGTDLPPPTYDYEGCPPHTMEACTKDKPKLCDSTTKCGFGQKCCPVSCNGMQCMPAGQKAGLCEDPKREVSLCAAGVFENSKAECAYDYQCGGNQKCCEQTCVKPLCKAPIKPGTCPITTQGCTGTISNKCTEDYDCTGNLKCCSSGCGRTCMAPESKPGECKPVNWAAIQCRAMDDAAKSYVCSIDAECPGEAKCCDSPCTEKRCRLPAQCPVFDPRRACLVKNPSECTAGQKCANGRSCCEYECGGTRSEPELCPGVDPNISCVTTNKQECNSSDACGADAICCAYECGGRKCIPRDIPAHSGYCPDYSNIKVKCPAVVPTDGCSSDAGCSAGKKCCTRMCGGLGCIDTVSEPPPPKPAAPVCPTYNKAADCKKRGSYTCNPSATCSNGGQCCSTECDGTSCLTGLCPAPENIVCVQAETRECETSATCGTGKVCCEIHCGGSRCKAPVGSAAPVDGGNPTDSKAVQGSPAPICPKPAANPSCPASIRSRACTSDAECGSKRCCDSGCFGGVKVCQTPIRPGTCPKPTVRCMEPKPSDQQNKCGTDMSCPGKQKCCHSPCPGFGDSCMDPVV